MLEQVVMACLELETQSVIHNDLKPDNILWFDIDQTSIHYNVDANGKTAVVENPDKKLWVLWDFGMMVRNGERDLRGIVVQNTLENDLKPFLKYLKGYPSVSRNGDVLRLVNQVERMCNDSSSVADLVDKMAIKK
jgi:hypothetical protein